MGYITFFPRQPAEDEGGKVPSSPPAANDQNLSGTQEHQDARTQPTPPPDNQMVWQPNKNLLNNVQERNSTLEGKIPNGGKKLTAFLANSIGADDK